MKRGRERKRREQRRGEGKKREEIISENSFMPAHQDQSILKTVCSEKWTL